MAHIIEADEPNVVGYIAADVLIPCSVLGRSRCVPNVISSTHQMDDGGT